MPSRNAEIFELSVESWLGSVWRPGRVNLGLVFQVNCPGCFLYALPQAERLRQVWSPKGLCLFALSTAFEDFELNTAENTRGLIEEHKLVGETARVLAEQQVDPKSVVLKIPVAIDRHLPDGRGETFARYHLPGTPTWLLLDEGMKFIEEWFGHQEDTLVERKIEAALNIWSDGSTNGRSGR